MYLAHDLFTMNYRSLIKCAAAENIVTQIDELSNWLDWFLLCL